MFKRKLVKIHIFIFPVIFALHALTTDLVEEEVYFFQKKSFADEKSNDISKET